MHIKKNAHQFCCVFCHRFCFAALTLFFLLHTHTPYAWFINFYFVTNSNSPNQNSMKSHYRLPVWSIFRWTLPYDWIWFLPWIFGFFRFCLRPFFGELFFKSDLFLVFAIFSMHSSHERFTWNSVIYEFCNYSWQKTVSYQIDCKSNELWKNWKNSRDLRSMQMQTDCNVSINLS